MKTIKASLALLAGCLTLGTQASVNVDFTGDGSSAGILSSCLVDLGSAINGSLGSEAPYTEMASTVGSGSNGMATVTAVNLLAGAQVTFTTPTWVAMNGAYTSGNEETWVRVTPLGSASCDNSDWSADVVTCQLPSTLGISLDEQFQVDTKARDTNGFPGTGGDYTLRTVVTCAG